MRQRKRQARVATHHREQHHLLLAVLYLGGVLLLVNDWLVTQNLLGS